MSEWLPDESIAKLNFEYMAHPEEVDNPEKLSLRLMRESLPEVTLGVIHTAIHNSDPRVRLSAATMVFDRVLGKVGTETNTGLKPIEVLNEALMIEVQQLLNANQQN